MRFDNGHNGHRGPGIAGLFGGAINRAINSASSAIGYSVGAGVGSAIGDAANKVTSQMADNVTTDMQLQSESKKMALEEQKKINNLPSKCPYCGAPTANSLFCEYCDSKIVS